MSTTLDTADASAAAERRNGPSRYSSRRVGWTRNPFSVISDSVRWRLARLIPLPSSRSANLSEKAPLRM
jgi:hypothetical protein